MAAITQLMTVSDLREVTFGHRPPRHGLKLLYWFATVAVEINEDGDMELQCDPDNGDYGFHHYANSEDLLPHWRTYFEVGNLNTFYHPGAYELPDYVKESYGRQNNCNERNKDRIIISLDQASRLIGEVYITEHLVGLSNFSRAGTFLLNPDIIREAGSMRLIDFLTRAGFLFPLRLGARIWEYAPSSDPFLDSEEMHGEWNNYAFGSCDTEEREGPDSKGCTKDQVALAIIRSPRRKSWRPIVIVLFVILIIVINCCYSYY